MPNTALPHFALRLKTLRKAKGLTQQELADRLGLKRAALGAYEEGRAEPRLINVIALADFFGVSADALLKGPDTAEERQRGKSMRILTVPVREGDAEERVAVVPVKAAAGYLEGYGDPEFVQGLRTFDLPLPEVPAQLTHRLFQIAGESMLPIPSGSYILRRMRKIGIVQAECALTSSSQRTMALFSNGLKIDWIRCTMIFG